MKLLAVLLLAMNVCGWAASLSSGENAPLLDDVLKPLSPMFTGDSSAGASLSPDQPLPPAAEPFVPVTVAQTVSLGQGRTLRLEILGQATFFDGGAPSSGYPLTIDIYDGDTLLQTIDHPAPPGALAAGSPGYGLSASLEDLGVSTQDFNGDGFADLRVFDSSGSVIASFSCYLWNPETGRFERHEALSGLSYPSSGGNGTVISFEKVGYQGFVNHTYKWRDGMLVPWELEQFIYPNFDDSCIRRVCYRNTDGEMKLVEDRYEYRSFENAEPNRGASPYTPPVIQDSRAPKLIKMAEACAALPDFDAPKDIPLKQLWEPLFEIAWAHNDDFLAAGHGVSQAMLRQLRLKYMIPTNWDPGNTGRYVRGGDLARTASYLFGDDFAWKEPDWYGLSPEERSGYGVCAGDPDFWTTELKWLGYDLPTLQIPLSLYDHDDSLVLETLSLSIFRGRTLYEGMFMDGTSILHTDFDNPVGYLTEEGQIYLYDDINFPSLKRQYYVFRPVDGERYILIKKSLRDNSAPS